MVPTNAVQLLDVSGDSPSRDGTDSAIKGFFIEWLGKRGFCVV
jgi:hypothetical protein